RRRIQASTVIFDELTWEQTFPYRREVPKAAVSNRSKTRALFDHFVGAQQESFRYFKTERLGSRQIDGKIELGRLLDRDVGRLRPAQNLVDIVGGAPVQVREVCSIGHQASRFDVVVLAVHRRQSRAQRQGVDANPVGSYEWVGHDIKCVRA